jgi:hypothetical protein
MTSKVDHPPHYVGQNNVYEAIKVIEAYDLNFHLGNAIKYILRAGKKSSDPTEDLEKAIWYLRRHILNVQHEPHTKTPPCKLT